MIVKLVVRSLQQGKMRFAMAVLGVAAATGLGVWSLGLTVTTLGQRGAVVRRLTAPYACWAASDGAVPRLGRRGAPGAGRRPKAGLPRGLPAGLVERIRALPGVEEAWDCHTLRTTVDFRPGGRVLQGPSLVATMALAPREGCPYEGVRIVGRWPDPEALEPEVALCSAVFAGRRLPTPPPGSPLVLLTPHGTVTVRISAVLAMDEAVGGFPTAFATRGALLAAADRGNAPPPNLLLCRLRDGAGGAGARRAVEQACVEAGVAFGSREELEAQYANDALGNFKRQAPLLLTLAVLTALCMLVNALTLGVEQRLRILALLRAAGMTVRQVTALVALEGLAMAGSGWLLGMLGGCAAVSAFVGSLPEAFPAGVVGHWGVPAASLFGIALIAAVSLIWPCRRALRIRPMEALAESEGVADLPEGRLDRAGRNASPRRAVLGFLLLFPMLLLVLPLPLTAQVRSVLLLAAGLPLHLFGLWLFLPAFIRQVERVAGPALSVLLGLDRRLLHRRISRFLARTAGMAVTLTVGLGGFAAIHIWGSSLTAPFLPSAEFPDVIVSLLPRGVDRGAAEKVARLEGVSKGRCLNIEAAQFALAEPLAERAARVSGRVPPGPNVLLWGVDPQAAFGGRDPLAPFRFASGERQAAADALAQGTACIVARTLAREAGLDVGDELRILRRPPSRRDSPAGREREAAPEGEASFRIVGVVDLQWHLVTSRAQMRGRFGMPPLTMGPVFVSEAAARRLTGNADRTCFLWLNLSESYRAKGALPAGRQLEAAIRDAAGIDAANTVRVHHRDEIADGTLAHGAELIGAMARAPFWSLIVLASGMATLMVASFHASSREFALMRAVGMTRGQLGRLWMGEALMTGCCGVALSLLSGFCIGWTFTGWTRAWMPFGGLPVVLRIPWGILLRGIGFTLLLCAAMALPPIVWGCRRLNGRT